jgi:hypothetical protein
MTDLVERLRTEAQEICSDTYPHWKNADETMNEAADKIEQLREQYDLVTTELRNKVAESQAREAKLREALEKISTNGINWYASIKDAGGALTALREAIEQAEKQEPVACVIDGDLYFHHEIDWEDSAYQDYSVELLYAVPPKPEWVGLTDEEIDEVQELAYRSLRQHKMRIRGQQITPADNADWHIVCAVEAKLKEKNHG